ncbi:NAT6 acetyltransferase, partial [Polyodon spathula]|nr:NAT6 acetyltransferase [Polyodon spathula]
MEATERYARSRGFWRLCLTTHDKQHFYAHLGFVLSEPVQNAGSMTTFMPMEVLQRFSQPPSTGREGDKLGLNRTSSPSPPHLSLTPPPPPPPLGLKTLGSQDPPAGQTLLETPYRDHKGQPIYWMKKEL